MDQRLIIPAVFIFLKVGFIYIYENRAPKKFKRRSGTMAFRHTRLNNGVQLLNEPVVFFPGSYGHAQAVIEPRVVA